MKILKALAIVVLAAGLSACWNRGFIDDPFLTTTNHFTNRETKLIKTDDASRVQVTAPVEASRKVSEVDCSRAYPADGGNILCK